MNELKIIGKQNISGMEFTGIEGGFGQDKKCMLVKDIAGLHGKKIFKINELINNNKKRFKENIDIIDLKEHQKSVILLKDNDIITTNSFNRTKNLYLLSERGYSKLLKIMDDDFAWEQYDKLVDDYFHKRKEINALSSDIGLNAITNLNQQLALMVDSVGNLNGKIDNLGSEVNNIKDTVKKKDNQIDSLIENMGLKARHTMRLTNYLKEKVTVLINSNETVKMNNPKCQRAKHKLFTYIGVNKWEDIPVNEETKAHAFIDSLEYDDLYYN